MADSETQATECTKCHAKDVPVQRCADCKEASYCSCTCQKDDWKKHKKECMPTQKMPARIPSHNTHLEVENSRGKELLLHTDEPTTYKLLIEAARLWDEAGRMNRGLMPDPRMGEQRYLTGYTFKYLQQFLDKVEKSSRIPKWWNKTKRAECEKLAEELWHWDDLNTGVPKEAWEPGRYDGTGLRSSLRFLVMDVDGGIQNALMNGLLHPASGF